MMSKFIECWSNIDEEDNIVYLNIDKIIKFNVGLNGRPSFFYIKVWSEQDLTVLPFRTKIYKGDEEYEEAYKEAKDYLEKFIEELNK
jgi:hypothetical protein